MYKLTYQRTVYEFDTRSEALDFADRVDCNIIPAVYYTGS